MEATTHHPRFQGYLDFLSAQTRQLVLDRLANGSRFFEAGSGSGHFVEATASDQTAKRAFWGQTLPANWIRAGHHHPHYSALMTLEIGDTVADIPKGWHPRHGWKTTTLTRVA